MCVEATSSNLFPRLGLPTHGDGYLMSKILISPSPADPPMSPCIRSGIRSGALSLPSKSVTDYHAEQ